MPSPVLAIDKLSKHDKAPVREAGLKAATRSLFKRTFNAVRAVDEITFCIEPAVLLAALARFIWRLGVRSYSGASA